MTRTWTLALASFAFAAAAAGCGGGGGSGGGPSTAVQFDQTRVDLVAVRGLAAPAATLRAKVAAGPHWPGVRSTLPDFLYVGYGVEDATTATVTIVSSVPAADLPAGRWTGTVEFLLCDDPQCAHVAASAAADVSVTVFGIDVAPLTFAAAEGSSPPAQSIAVTPADTAHQLAITVPSTTPAWLSAARSSDAASFSVTASGAGLTAGTYAGEVHVGLAARPSDCPLSPPIAPALAHALAEPDPVTIRLDHASTPASVAGTIPVAFQAGLSPSWTATSSKPWLVLDEARGTGSGAIGYSIDASAAAAVRNWTADFAVVRISAAHLADVLVTVALDKRLPEARTVAAPVRAGAAATALVHGRGFSQLSSASDLVVEGAGAVSGAIGGDDTATLTLPALAVGHHGVSIANAMGIPTPVADLYAAAGDALPAGSVERAGTMRNAVFDVTRQALYVVSKDPETLVRYRLDGSTWRVDAWALDAIGELTLSPDAATLWVTTGDAWTGAAGSAVLEVDPDTLEVRARHEPPPGFPDPITSLLSSADRGLAYSWDGRLWLESHGACHLPYLDTVDGVFGMAEPQGPYETTLSSPRVYASRDGSRVFFAAAAAITPWSYTMDPLWHYTPGDGTTSAELNESQFPQRDLALSADGHVAIRDRRWIFTRDPWIQIGAMLDGYLAVELSPDGRRAYGAWGSYGTVTQIDVYDTTFPPARIGTVPVDAAISAYCGGQTCPDTILRISPLGDALFLLGDRRMVVVPIPDALSGLGGS